MKLSYRKVRRANDYAFDNAGELNTIEVLAALFDHLGVPYSTDSLRSRDGRKIKANDLRAILTAVWYEDKEDLTEEEAKMMERYIKLFAPTEGD